MRTTTRDPGAELAALLASGRVPAQVDLHRPSLDDLYRSLKEAPAAWKEPATP